MMITIILLVIIVWLDTQTWVIECLKMYKISDKIINIRNSMEYWRVELTVRVQTLAAVKIQKDIFQGESLSPLL